MHNENTKRALRDACQEGAAGCLRCTLQAQECAAPQTALLLACHNNNVRLALGKALTAGELPYHEQGAFLLIGGARARVGAITAFLKEHLSAATQEAVKGVFVRENANGEERAQTACFHAEPLPALMGRWEHEWARQALAEGWMFSMYQPIIDARNGSVFAYESLIRARNPHSGQVIGAGPLIQSCERLGLHHQLDQRARQCAIRGAASLGIANARYFINFMPNTIYDPEICLRTTMEAAREVDMSLHRLVFEVVETEDIPDMKRLCHILDYYRSRGVGTAVDDLGAGFASLPYLDALRPDYAKIDRDIVVRAVTEQESRDKLNLIVGTAKSLGIRVIAEGIETPQQLAVCRQAGVDYLQGYLFARPALPPVVVPVEVQEEHFPALALAS